MGATVNSVSGNAQSFYVTVVTPKGSMTKKIDGDLMSVGRGEDCNLTITHETLSRRHLTVILRNGQCWVEDHGSSNGTFINGKRVKPHAAIRVLPEDYVQLGQSGVRLSVSAEPQMWKSTTPPVPDSNDKMPVPIETIKTSTLTERQLQRVANVPEPKQTAEAQEQAERLMQDAQKRSAALIQEAEVEAERRVQDIYRRAHETQAKMDESFQRRMNEAYRAAEKMYQKAQGESETILDDARHKSTEIRTQAEGFVMELRRRTEEDCERILGEAQQTARELKENRLAEAEEMLRRKEETLISSTREAMNTRLARFEEDLLKEAARQREVLETELNDRRAQLEDEQKEQVTTIKTLKKEVQSLTNRRNEELDKQKHIESVVEQGAKRAKELEEASERHKNEVADLTSISTNLRKEIASLTASRDEGKAALAKVKVVQDSLDAELLRLREKAEEARVKYQKDEQKHLEELKLETTRKVQRLEQQLVHELADKRERLTREMVLSIEAHLKDKDGKTSGLHGTLNKVFEAQIHTLSSDPGAKEKEKSLVSLKRREKWFTAGMGLVLGAVMMFGAQKVYRKIKADQNPFQKRVTAEADARKADLERRKFNPMQTKELKVNYADSVLYTENFTQIYLNEEFQKKFLQEATPFLLKTWRVEEEKVIQLLSLTSTLVKELQDRRENIHPDFIPQGIEKMKELEEESTQRMRKLLGSQVRVESFRKFERKFYEGWPQ